MEVCNNRRCTRVEKKKSGQEKKRKGKGKEGKEAVSPRPRFGPSGTILAALCTPHTPATLNLLLFLHLGRCGVRTGVRSPENETTPQGS